MYTEFTYTLADLREARRVANENARGRASRPFRRGVLGWVVFVGLALVLVYLLTLNKQPPTAAPAPPPAATPSSAGAGLLLDLVPWLLVVAFLYLVVFRGVRKARRRQEETLLQPMALDVSPGGVTLTNGPAQTRWQWQAFTRWVETDAQFLLQLGHTDTVVAIPKRLATDPADLAAIGELIAAHVNPPVGAFPVLPVATPDGTVR